MKEPLFLSRLPFVWRFSFLERHVYRSVNYASQEVRKAFQLRHGARYRWPFYDVARYFLNREPKRLYRIHQTRMAPRPVEQKVIRDLREEGISIIHFSDLLPIRVFSEFQESAETTLREPAIQEKIKAIGDGARPDAKSGKYFIVRPLGDTPVVDIKDGIMVISLSDPILRIVCAYLGMFGRLTALDLWYNVATSGPDVASQRWHRDPEDKRIVKTFLYLRDVDAANGPFCYIRGTHNGGPFKGIYPQTIAGLNYPEDGAIDRKFPPNLKQVCTGKAGTLIFCDTTGFHRGGHPTSGARLLFNAVYTTNASQPLIAKTRQLSLVPSRIDLASPAAGYAIGHLAAD